MYENSSQLYRGLRTMCVQSQWYCSAVDAVEMLALTDDVRHGQAPTLTAANGLPSNYSGSQSKQITIVVRTNVANLLL